MSVRGAKGTKAVSAVGTHDGFDAGYRQHIMNRYEAMATYRRELATRLFPLAPCAFAAGVVLTVMHFQAPGLAPLARTFLPPFAIMIGLMLVSAAVSLRSIYLQSNKPLLLASSVVTLLLVALSSVYGTAAYSVDMRKSGEAASRIWWVAGAAVHAFNALVQARAVYCGYLITKLQEDKSKR